MQDDGTLASKPGTLNRWGSRTNPLAEHGEQQGQMQPWWVSSTTKTSN